MSNKISNLKKPLKLKQDKHTATQNRGSKNDCLPLAITTREREREQNQSELPACQSKITKRKINKLSNWLEIPKSSKTFVVSLSLSSLII
jgi:hypothetical protein